MGFLRFVPAGILLAGAVALRNRRTHPAAEPPRGRRRLDRRRAACCSAAWASSPGPSRRSRRGIAALLVALMPMWLAIFGLAFFGERLPRAGVDRDRRRRRGRRDPRLADRGASTTSTRPACSRCSSRRCCWALGAIYAARRAVLPAPALFASGLEMIAGGLVLLVASAVTGELAPRSTRPRSRPRAGSASCTCCWSAAWWATRRSPGWCRSRRSRAWPPTRT